MFVCILLRVQCGWNECFEVSHDQFLKALHDHRGECNRAIFRHDTVDFLGTGVMEVYLKQTGMTACSREMLKIIRQLVGTFLENAALDAVWPASFAWVHPKEGPPNIVETDSTWSPGGGVDLTTSLWLVASNRA